MPKNKKESFVFTVIMCSSMVFLMSLYNIALHQGGFSVQVFEIAIKGFLPGLIVGMVFDWFLVSKGAKKLAFKLIKPEDQGIKKIVIISTCMVTGMVLCMSFYGALINVGFSKELPAAYLKGILMNFIVALPLQLVIVGPFVRFIFCKIYPPKLVNN